jgi:hypothetical protein
LHWYLCSILNQLLYMVREFLDPFLVSSWISSFPSTICWRGCISYNVYFGLLWWKSMTIALWIYVWASVPLVNISVFVLFHDGSFTVALEYSLKPVPPGLLFLLNFNLILQFFCAAIWILGWAFLFLWRITLGFWGKFNWIYRLPYPRFIALWLLLFLCFTEIRLSLRSLTQGWVVHVPLSQKPCGTSDKFLKWRWQAVRNSEREFLSFIVLWTSLFKTWHENTIYFFKNPHVNTS